MDIEQSHPIVSVIVLTYNNFDNIEQNLKSILSQEYENIEIIVHDDGSKDFPHVTVEKVLSNCNKKYGYRIKRNVSNVGTVKNYNRAIKLARGDIIVPLAQDDVFCDSRCIGDIVSFFEKTGCAVCTGGRIGSVTHNKYPNETDARLLKKRDIKTLLFRIMIRNFISGAALYFDKGKIAANEDVVFDEKYLLLEDYPFIYKCLSNDICIEFIDRDFIYYGEAGVSGTKKSTSTKLLRDEISFYGDVIIPATNMYHSELVKKYVYYRYLKLVDELNNRLGKKSHKALFYLLGNFDLSLLLCYMSGDAILERHDDKSARYDLLYKIEQKAAKRMNANIPRGH